MAKIQGFKKQITKFEIKGLSPTKRILGLEIRYQKSYITISQKGYFEKILNKFNMKGKTNGHFYCIPLEDNPKTNQEENELENVP